MIQSILLFLLGFLAAGFIAVLVAPAIWRRAVALTQRRIEASMPLSLNELQAEKDRNRATFAMATRKLEIQLKTQRETANLQAIELDRQRDEIRRLGGTLTEREAVVASVETQAAQLATDLDLRAQEVDALSARLAAAEAAIEVVRADQGQLSRLYEDASYTASERQIELVAREADIERISGNLGTMRAERIDAERRLQEAQTEARQAQDAARFERKRALDLERKMEKLMATSSDREEKLDRRDKEVERLREQLRNSIQPAELDARTAALLADRTRLEAELSRLRARRGAPAGDDELRERIAQLAAEVVRMTAQAEGPGSPIEALLSNAAPGAQGTSLADRIRTLQASEAAD